MKKCYKCCRELQLTEFNKNKSKPDGLATECKDCKKVQDKLYRENHLEKYKARKHEYYLENKDHIVNKTNLWIAKNIDKHRDYCNRSKDILKSEVLGHYSGEETKCKCCGVKEMGILTIDHLNDNGAEHRREIFGENHKKGGYNFYRWLKKNNYPADFQVLCYNCQFRKLRALERSNRKTHLQEVRAAYVRSIKLECLDHYGGRQCGCGESDIEVLTLDHVNDDGAEHRREKGVFGFNFYMMLRKSEFPDNVPLQTLCFNCQIRKRNKKYEEGKIRQTDDSDDATISL